jgi:hypothetical protein
VTAESLGPGVRRDDREMFTRAGASESVTEKQHRLKNMFSTADMIDESLLSTWHHPSKDVSKFIKK